MGRIKVKEDPSQLDEAEGLILQGIQMLKELKLKPFLAFGYFCLGELHADAGHREEALKNLKKAETMYREMGIDYWLERTREVLGRL